MGLEVHNLEAAQEQLKKDLQAFRQNCRIGKSYPAGTEPELQVSEIKLHINQGKVIGFEVENQPGIMFIDQAGNPRGWIETDSPFIETVFNDQGVAVGFEQLRSTVAKSSKINGNG